MFAPLYAAAGLLATQTLANPLNAPLPPGAIFDYVVVGGGPAGLTVANQLTENPAIQVLLLEAGDADVYEQKIMVPAFQGSSGFAFGACGGYNWCSVTEPQAYLNNQTRIIPQGKGLGGGTLINAMLWNRGDTQDYDTWAALGNEGWDFASMLPYFERSETFTPEPDPAQATAYEIGEDPSIHGFVGPQNVTFPNFKYTPSENFFAAMNGMGIPTQLDPDNPPAKGAMFLAQGISPWNQSRNDARRARWDPVQTRPNFWVSTHQTVQRILFEGGCGPSPLNGTRAVGVEVISDPGQPAWTAVATREVILAAGAIHSPQVLELSGIGDTNVLQGVGIQTRLNLPGVGNNLQDHMLMHMAQAFNNQSYIYSNMLSNATINDAAQQLYYLNRTGPWTFGPPDGNAFLSLPQFSQRANALAAQAAAQGDADYLAPGLDPSVIRGYAQQRALLIPALNDTSRGAIEFLQDDSGNTEVSNMRPLTRGSTHIVSDDGFEPSALDFRYGSNPVDYDVMFDALRWNDALFQTPEIQIMQPQQIAPPHGGTDEDFQFFLNNSLGTEFHPSCTNAMLAQENGGVVNTNLLVYGTQNLRIVDASIFPIVPAAHLEAVVYGVAEKAADIIKAAQAVNPPQTPTVPLDLTNCTIVPTPSSISSTVTKRHRHHSTNTFPRRQTSAPEGESAIPTQVGAYPNYEPQPAFNFPPDAQQASKGLPKGAALDYGTELVNGVGDLVQGLLGGLENGLGSLLGEGPGNPSPPSPSKRP